MYTNSSGREGHDPPRPRNVQLIRFLVTLLCAVAIGVGIRYYNARSVVATGTAWEVYFSEVGGVNDSYSLEKRLVDRLSAAGTCVDAALYHLSSAPIADALIAAHKRGVEVRVVTEADNVGEEEIGRLKKAGIQVVDDDNDAFMHHKFIVIDEQYVWTGSYNTTYNGAYRNNNNVVLINSAVLAYTFTQEFRGLFFDLPVQKQSGMSAAYPEVRLSDGTQIFTYFSPHDDTLSPLLLEIEAARESIRFMAFSFTHDALGQAMRERFRSGVEVEGVFEERQVDNRYSEYQAMEKEGVPVIKDQNTGTMHHKVIVIDEETVITGSYNFSKNAEERNSENLLIIKGNSEIAAAYVAEFEKIVPR